MRELLPLAAIAVALLGGAVVACSSMTTDSAFGARDNGGSSGAAATDGGAFAAPSAGDSTLAPTDNGVIMVHAAGLPAYRLCFENELDRLPQPDAQVMPDANVVGVEVGSAVRIDPLKGPPGKIWIFEEPLVRSFSGSGSTCRNLLANSTFFASAHEMPAIDTDLSHGVHLLVVAGCTGKTFVSYTKAECGQDYDENLKDGNLHIVEKELKGATRNPGELPTQVVHLSQAVESARNGQLLSVSFGVVGAGSAPPPSKAEDPLLFGAPLDLVGPPTFDATDESVYANVGFRVTLSGADAGPTTLAAQSLADVQKLSAPREIPTTYYSVASNYVLLLLGDPAPKSDDGGIDDDPLRKVHLLAVPVIEPKPDGGADGGGALDGGSAPDGGT